MQLVGEAAEQLQFGFVQVRVQLSVAVVVVLQQFALVVV